MCALAFDAVFSFSTTPMRLATRIGVLIVSAGMLYFLWVLFRAIFLGGLVAGWASVLSAVVILGGAQLAFVGVIGEYVARVFEEVKHRPLYFFKQVPAALDHPIPPDRRTKQQDRGHE
ncbi:MAG: hypothetical protein HKN13_11635 [Rhodothermales bacterium]|nr:hypothetical protein [Rhodothermales bacterium]